MTTFDPGGANRATEPPVASNDATAHTFTFDSVPIPAVLVGDTVWLSGTALCRALRLRITSKVRAGRYLGKLNHDDVDHRYMQTVGGSLQGCTVVTLQGALALTRERTRRVDQRVRAMLNREAKPLMAPASPPLQTPRPSL